MLIDKAYFLPDGLFEAVQSNANEQRKCLPVGILYKGKVGPGTGFFYDLKYGWDCTYLYGESYDELRTIKGMAVICWITPEVSNV